MTKMRKTLSLSKLWTMKKMKWNLSKNKMRTKLKILKTMTTTRMMNSRNSSAMRKMKSIVARPENVVVIRLVGLRA